MRRSKNQKRWAVLMMAALAASLSVGAVPTGETAAGPLPPPGPGQRPVGEPRYAVAVSSFRAIDESGYDRSGSDEVFGVFRSGAYGERTSTYGDVDSGDRVYFTSLERCVVPPRLLSGRTTNNWLIAPGATWECNPRGVAAPIELRLDLWEDDPCDPFGFPGGCFDSGFGVVDPADDLIGRVEVTYDAAELARLDNVGDSMNVGFVLGGPCGHQEPGGDVCGYGPLSPTGPEYELRVVIQRMSDAPPRNA